MNNPSYQTPHHTFDACQQPVVHVPTSDGGSAIVDANTYERLIQAGIPSHWTVASDGDDRFYVRCRHNGQMQTVSRLIMDASPSILIRYRNGNRRDLRMNNLQAIQKKAPKHGQ
jgi:hypothetical protein